MGYYEVLNWLVNRRVETEEYYSPADIQHGLRGQYQSDNGVSGYCLKLEHDGYVEARMSMDIKNWLRVYRATKKAVEGRYG